MSVTDALCALPPRPPGCCDPPPAPIIAPIRPDNPPGLPAIRYRIGTFTSFRRAMLGEIRRCDLVADTENPFAAWHEGTDGDYHTLFIELWAYLADVLTFYQERIANEAYLPTAKERDSLLRLAGLIDYRPSPGAGATGLVAITVERGKSTTIPAGFRVGSRATPGKPAAVFETAEAITAVGEHSAIPLALAAPANQFGLLSGGATRRVILDGTSTRLAVGDYVLIVQNETTGGESTAVRQITAVSADPAAKTTTIDWSEPSGTVYQNISLYAFRVTAGPFGNQAPDWNTLPVTLIGPGGAYEDKRWDKRPGEQEGSDWTFLPVPGDDNHALFLDAVYEAVKGTPENPGWTVLLADNVSRAFHVVDARHLGKAAYTITAKVTRLTFHKAVPARTFPLRGTVVLTGAERLTLEPNQPLSETVSGTTLRLAGLFPQLRAGQTVIVRGRTPAAPSDAVEAEAAILDGPPLLEPASGLTTVTLKNALSRQYVRRGVKLLANVVEVTQGETVRDEILGSSDASALQSYPLKQKPLTYLPATDPEGLAATESTLGVTVNGVRWTERRTLLDSSPRAQEFTTALDDTGRTTVAFGDGFHGARPPTGRDNIHARYRKGLGVSGNVAPGGIQQLVDSLPGVQKVANPEASQGGVDQESIARLRVNAPGSVQTFGRAVSVADYAVLARSYPGVAKANATWLLRDPVTLHALSHPYIGLTVAGAGGRAVPQRALRAFLDRRRDPNVPLRIGSATPVYVDVEATIDVDDRAPREATLASALAALNPELNPDQTPGFFAFDRLDFGQSIYLSAVYAALQAVPGVRDATITTLRRRGPSRDPAGTVREHIFIRPTEIATIKNDPADTGNEFGKLKIVRRSGGFEDT